MPITKICLWSKWAGDQGNVVPEDIIAGYMFMNNPIACIVHAYNSEAERDNTTTICGKLKDTYVYSCINKDSKVLNQCS